MKNASSEIPARNLEILDFEKEFADRILEIQAEAGLSFWSRRDYLAELERSDSIFKTARAAGDEIVGFALVRLLAGASASFDSAEILNIAVRDAFRRKGVGQIIFDAVLDALAAKNVGEIWLEVRASNAAAIAFYRKNGFAPQFERKNYYQNPPENALIFRRPLD